MTTFAGNRGMGGFMWEVPGVARAGGAEAGQVGGTWQSARFFKAQGQAEAGAVVTHCG